MSFFGSTDNDTMMTMERWYDAVILCPVTPNFNPQYCCMSVDRWSGPIP